MAVTAASLPPGETGRELSGSDAFAAMHEALKAITEPPRVACKGVKDIDVRTIGRWVVVTIRFTGTETNEITFRMRRSWALVLRGRLNQVLR